MSYYGFPQVSDAALARLRQTITNYPNASSRELLSDAITDRANRATQEFRPLSPGLNPTLEDVFTMRGGRRTPDINNPETQREITLQSNIINASHQMAIDDNYTIQSLRTDASQEARAVDLKTPPPDDISTLVTRDVQRQLQMLQQQTTFVPTVSSYQPPLYAPQPQRRTPSILSSEQASSSEVPPSPSQQSFAFSHQGSQTGFESNIHDQQLTHEPVEGTFWTPEALAQQGQMAPPARPSSRASGRTTASMTADMTTAYNSNPTATPEELKNSVNLGPRGFRTLVTDNKVTNFLSRLRPTASNAGSPSRDLKKGNRGGGPKPSKTDKAGLAEFRRRFNAGETILTPKQFNKERNAQGLRPISPDQMSKAAAIPGNQRKKDKQAGRVTKVPARIIGGAGEKWL
jgi:hypothetical protein